jgi:ATP-dependent Clp protease ATP-binding subunit ClpX
MDGVDEAIVNREVVEGRAQPLYAYADKKEDPSAKPEMAS